MSDRKPQVIDLRKQDEDEQDPGRNPETEMDTESEGDVYENVRDLDADDEEPDDGPPEDDGSGNVANEAAEEQEDDSDTTKSEDEKAFSLRSFNLTQKFEEGKGFSELKEGSLCLIDTPLDGAKVGEVVGKEESWTGTLYVKVDTGANKYDITPYEDEFSEKYIATIGEQGEVTPDLLQRLGKTDVDKVEVGNQVILDIPKMGPVRGTVAHKASTETQGTKVDVNTGPATFTIYEEPSPTQKKEQPMIVGQVQ